jgi:hypothetical protein
MKIVAKRIREMRHTADRHTDKGQAGRHIVAQTGRKADRLTD